MDHFCYLCFEFVMFSCLFIADLLSPVGGGLASCMLCLCFCHFPKWCPVWYLIVLIPDLCLLTYLEGYMVQFLYEST